MNEFIGNLILRLDELLKITEEIKQKCEKENVLLLSNIEGCVTGYSNAKYIIKKLAEKSIKEENTKKYTDKELDEILALMFEEKPKTNADKIRAMTDEELAEYIFGVSIGNAPCVLCSDECDFCKLSDEQCKGKTLKWLQSEAE